MAKVLLKRLSLCFHFHLPDSESQFCKFWLLTIFNLSWNNIKPTLMFWTCKPVLRCRLSKGAFSSEKPQGVGISEWGGNGGGGMEVGRSVYKQPGTRVDGILSQQGGFQVSKGE